MPGEQDYRSTDQDMMTRALMEFYRSKGVDPRMELELQDLPPGVPPPTATPQPVSTDLDRAAFIRAFGL